MIENVRMVEQLNYADMYDFLGDVAGMDTDNKLKNFWKIMDYANEHDDNFTEFLKDTELFEETTYDELKKLFEDKSASWSVETKIDRLMLVMLEYEGYQIHHGMLKWG